MNSRIKKDMYDKEFEVVEKIKLFNNGKITKEEFNTVINEDYYKLPSGLLGNIVALAIELNCYYTANYIVSSNLVGEIDIIASNGRKSFSIEELLKMADKTKVNKKDIDNNDDKLMREFLMNEGAYYLLKTNITLKDKTSFKK